MRRCDVPSSKLASTNSFSHVALPVGPGCFYPPRNALSSLVNKVKELQGVNINDVQMCLKDMQYWKSAHTYKVPDSPEGSFTRANLDILMNSILNRIPESQIKHKLSVQSAEGIKNKIPFFFAKSSSLSEPVVMFRWDDTSVGLIASEAKALDASMYQTYAQAVQVASDCAVNLGLLFAACGISTQDIIVPFITTSWDVMQFGAVYLMDNYYPSAVLLSSQLSLNCRTDMLQICYWIIALAQHCYHMGNMLEPLCAKVNEESSPPALYTTSSSSSVKRVKPTPLAKGTTSSIRGTLKSPSSLDYYETASVCLPSSGKYFYKPLTLTTENSPESFRALLSGLMSRFYDLYHFSNTAVRDLVVFPEGIIAYPDKYQDDIKAFLRQEFQTLCQLKSIDENSYETASYCTAGYPIVLYPMLDPSIWTRSDALLKEPNDILVSMFIDSVKVACELFTSAGIVHTDLRLYNIFYRVDYSECNKSIDMVHIKVLDWDDSVRLNEHIPRELLQCRESDGRFPARLTVATGEYHMFFVQALEEQLSDRWNYL